MATLAHAFGVPLFLQAPSVVITIAWRFGEGDFQWQHSGNLGQAQWVQDPYETSIVSKSTS